VRIYHDNTQRAMLALVPLAAAAAVYLLNPGLRSTVNQTVLLVARADIAPVRDHVLAWGVWAPVGSALLQVLTSVLAPLPSFVLSFVNAMLFGFVWGALLTWTTALLAAGICFSLARALGRPAVERLATRRALEGVDHFFARRGVWAVITARLIPFINPDVVSYAAGLTAIRWRVFLLAIGVGSVPSTLLYSYLGSRGVTSVGWLLVPLVGLGLLALLGGVVAARRARGRPRTGTTPATTAERGA
jgi:uncharacterized membrane protein YdjX (TVP38/TMEM64 family)